MPYRYSLYHISAKRLILVKNTNKLKTAFFVEYLVGNSFTEISRSDKNCLYLFIYAEYLADFAVKLRHVVAVTLLSEAAETIEIVAYLGSSESHSGGKLLRAYAYYAVFLKGLQKAVITGEALDNGYGDIILYRHFALPR